MSPWGMLGVMVFFCDAVEDVCIVDPLADGNPLQALHTLGNNKAARFGSYSGFTEMPRLLPLPLMHGNVPAVHYLIVPLIFMMDGLNDS